MAEFEPLDFTRLSLEHMVERAREFRELLQRRRTVREYSSEAVPLEVITESIRAAGLAPSGANMQPWHFVVVKDPKIKNQIRVEAEEEESEFYAHKAPPEWLEALAALGTDQYKPFLEEAPFLIVVFAKSYGIRPGGGRIKHYYVQESVGIATGFLITALHSAGLATLTHTPSPMKFLNRILDRPANEKPFLILVVGYPADHATVPKITKENVESICTIV